MMVHGVNSGISFTEVRVNGRLAYFSQAFISAIVYEFKINVTMTVRVDEDGEIYLELVSK